MPSHNITEKQLTVCRDLVLANLILLGQIPAETKKEKERLEAVFNRFQQNSELDSYIDGKLNAVAELNHLNPKKACCFIC